MKRLAALVIAALLIAITASPASAQGLEDPIPEAIGNARIAVALEPLADGLVAPLWGTTAPGHRHHLYVVDQPGQLWAVDIRNGDKAVVADVSSLLVELGAFGPGTFDERGFLGVAFDKRFGRNGYLYTFTSEPVDGPADFSTMPPGTDADHQSVITRWRSTDPSDPYATVDPTSREVLLRIDEPQFNHNAGALEVGPDGMLYIALGDGGGADDVDGQLFIGEPIVGHGTGNGQDLTNPLGSILRIDPHGSNSANGAYGIPADNPFTGSDAVEETFAYGFRNPYRMSFDRKTGRLWTGDVGQNDIEEVDIVRAGRNYGWNLKEGSFVFDPNGDEPGFVTAPADLGTEDPVAEYDHDEGVAIVGGYVYRGRRIKQLQGRYVFGEFARTFSNDGRLFITGRRSGKIEELLLPEQNGLGISLFGFGQDTNGELYVVGNSTGVPFGDTGVVWKLVPAEAKTRFEADLSGDAEVPPVTTDTSGEARLRADRRWTELDFDIRLRNAVGVTQAHIHLGGPDENGPVVAFLFGFVDPPGVDVPRGRLANGTLTADDLIGPLEGQPLSALLAELQAGNAYVNVHTVANAGGEVRGQIQAKE
ncbi:MAG: PQQ-dependent sugar dehydrogenase [Acidimicrobiia bacterium]|nr:PQQ-dependent sugar dehydrogenase [Acidimicrobiia bacterium]